MDQSSTRQRIFPEIKITQVEDQTPEYIQFSEKKKERQNIETIAKVLVNRVALLKQTEIKALNNLSKTQKRNEVLLRRRSEWSTNQKNSKPINTQEDKEHIVKQLKEKLKRKKMKAFVKLQSQKQTQYKIVKQEEEELIRKRKDELSRLTMMNHMKQLQSNNFFKRSNSIKQSVFLANLRKQEYKDKLQTQVKQQYFEKRNIEEKQISQRQKEIDILENLESHLVQNLRKTQNLQQQALEQMKMILNYNQELCKQNEITQQETETQNSFAMTSKEGFLNQKAKRAKSHDNTPYSTRQVFLDQNKSYQANEVIVEELKEG